MRIHTVLDAVQMAIILHRAMDDGKIGSDVTFAVFDPHASRTHQRAFEIQLGTDDSYLPAGTLDQYGKRMRVRRNRNSPNGTGRYAATWHEWGWFLNEVFNADPSAKTSYYENRLDFDRKTNNEFAQKPAWTRGHP